MVASEQRAEAGSRWQPLDAESAVKAACQQAVDKVPVGVQGDNHATKHFDLVVPTQAAVKHEHDPGMKLTAEATFLKSATLAVANTRS